jgi:DnaJ-class molecular chaperone
VIPVDLIPDFLGLPGRFDDLLIALGTLYFLLSKSKEIPGTGGAREARSSREGQRGHEGRRESESASSRQAEPGSLDPYEVLGVDRGEGFEEIRRRYKEKLLQYHPDRVLHLGREFQEMAERKAKEITEAFQKIQKERETRSR